MDAIYKAISSLDHDDSELHTLEIEACADIALVKMLAFLEFKTGFRRPPIVANIDAITKEISLTCQALEMVYRASSEAVEKSFKRVGTDLMQIIVILVEEEIKSRLKAYTPNSPQIAAAKPKEPTEQDKEGETNDAAETRSVTPPPLGNLPVVGNWDTDLLLRKASKIIGHFARVGQATRPVAHFPGLLGTILALINVRPYELIPWEARLSCLWAIANLACNTDNMMMMICTPGLIDSLINVGFRQIHLPEPLERTMEVLRAKSISSRALLNLSWPSENKILMSENAALLQSLCHLAVQRDFPHYKSKTMQNLLTKTRRHSIGTLRNLAAAPRRSKIGLCEYKDGAILDTLLSALVNDSDAETVDLALAALYNLATHDTAKFIAAKEELVRVLNQCAKDKETEKDPTKPMDHASSVLLVLKRSITPEMDSYNNLKEYIGTINPPETSSKDDEADSAHVFVV